MNHSSLVGTLIGTKTAQTHRDMLETQHKSEYFGRMVKNDVSCTQASRTKDGSAHRRCDLDLACCCVLEAPECPLSVAESSSNIDEQPPQSEPSELSNGFVDFKNHFESPGDIFSKTEKLRLESIVRVITSY